MTNSILIKHRDLKGRSVEWLDCRPHVTRRGVVVRPAFRDKLTIHLLHRSVKRLHTCPWFIADIHRMNRGKLIKDIAYATVQCSLAQLAKKDTTEIARLMRNYPDYPDNVIQDVNEFILGYLSGCKTEEEIKALKVIYALS